MDEGARNPQSTTSGSTTSGEDFVPFSQMGSLAIQNDVAPAHGEMGDNEDRSEDVAIAWDSLPTHQASRSDWRHFENFFNADHYQHVDNSHNLNSHQFLLLWSRWYAMQEPGRHPEAFNKLPPVRTGNEILGPSKSVVSAHDLDEDECNFQGFNWAKLRTTSSSVREARRKTYIHKTNTKSNEERQDSLHRSPPFTGPNASSRVRRLMNSIGLGWAREIRRYDNHFRFRRMFLENKPHLAHFQLRNMISASSRNAVFYAEESSVKLLNPLTGNSHDVMDVTPWYRPILRGRITTLTASDGFLIVGGWNGQYAIKSLLSEDDNTWTEGLLPQMADASINHIHTFLHRQSQTPHAAISSNDEHIRIIDCSTNTTIQTTKLNAAVNCSVTSPDGRLRLIVGDQTEPWILSADSGALLVRLPNHRDYGFACDWAADGVHAATGNQDGMVQIWDSRNWARPLQVLSTELSGVRAMQFSPLGSGRRVLAMAEPADLVHVVDAERFESEQRFEFLGEIGGLSFEPGGRRLYVGITDWLCGGIVEFERAGEGEKYGMARPKGEEWTVDEERVDDGLLMQSERERKRRGIGLGDVMI
ncbi:MAG: hypothetical protein HETSPECPRED_007790 [Heterodermia speciosa]|uniref:WD40 repeat-like protein n=1 Tax=Heterodermia speciosa TaxID=116794 RepID=A0A8H3IXJ4_9LECA|nr:MAG: hypothetical protein HETSPECPRED_007790 [Heterodermia speciosa]